MYGGINNYFYGVEMNAGLKSNLITTISEQTILMIKDLAPPEAWKILQSDPAAVLLDVRSRMEYDYVGHVPDSVFVSLKEPPDWQSEPEFVANVKRALAECRPGQVPEELTILALCRSGARSMRAAEELVNNGFKQVFNVSEGFEGDRDEQGHRNSTNGWRFHGLPWLQS
jgi:rhodanese-related sulfurtransferase